jgi:single-stranded-DNA-specific exonuclease
MARVLGISPVCARVLANRGIRSKNAALAYLRADMGAMGRVLSEKNGMKDAKKAFLRIAEAIANRERATVYGDYDADGVMATVILCKALRALGLDAGYYIPDREDEGYGLNADAVRSLKKAGTDLLIACDNGIAAHEEIALANELGMDVVVIDHHEPGLLEEAEKSENGGDAGVMPNAPREDDAMKRATVLIVPKQADCPYPFKELCAAGLSFVLMKAFYEYMGRDFSGLHDELLALCGVATVCDIVELLGENRALVKNALDVLNANKRVNPGLGRLIELKGYLEKPLDTFTLGFVLGPCINATGRLDSAEMAVRLFLTDDENERNSLANALSALNEERKRVTAESAERVMAQAEAAVSAGGRVLVLTDEQTHESVAGIVAGRVKDAFNRPVILLTRGALSGAPVLKGSGRSIEGYNLFENLYKNRALFLRFGGHAMAAGLTLAAENAPRLRERLDADCVLSEADFRETLHIDGELSADDITLELARELEICAPFGKGNREPLFLTRGLAVTSLRVIEDKNTLIFTFGSGARKLRGVAFGLNERFLGALRGRFDEQTYRRMLSGFLDGLFIDAVYSVGANTYNGATSVQVQVRDFRLAS